MNFVTVVKPSGAAVSVSEYVPALRYSNVTLLPSKSTDVTSFATASPPLIFTPSSVMPSPSAVRVNSALPASLEIGSPPSAFLSRLMIGISSMITRAPPSSVFTTPSVTALTSVTRPLLTVNVNSDTVEKPSGAAVSFSVYSPSARYSSFVLLPSKSAEITAPRASPPLILTPSSVAFSPFAVRVNSALLPSMIFAPRSVLSITRTGASSTTIWPSSPTETLPVVPTSLTFTTLPSSSTSNVKELTTE